MKVLKHSITGRFFEATPELLKHKKMVPASDEETQAYLSEIKPEQLKELERHTVKVIIPDDFDLDTDTSTFGKVQLLAVGTKLGLKFPETMKTKDLKVLVEQAMAEARKMRDEKRKAEADAEADA